MRQHAQCHMLLINLNAHAAPYLLGALPEQDRRLRNEELVSGVMRRERSQTWRALDR